MAGVKTQWTDTGNSPDEMYNGEYYPGSPYSHDCEGYYIYCEKCGNCKMQWKDDEDRLGFVVIGGWILIVLAIILAGTGIGITALRDGTILWPFLTEFFKLPCCQVRRYATYVYRSRDHGLTWEGDEPIPTRMREPITYGHLVELPSGKILMPVWGAFRLGERWQVGVFESSDGGRTWKNYKQIAYDPQAGSRPDNGFNETTIAQLPDGTLVAILRQQRVGAPAGPTDVYTEPADNFYRAISRDSGKTWSRPERLALIGTSPALHVLPDGTLMLGYRDSPQQGTDVEHYGLAIRISQDQGATSFFTVWTRKGYTTRYTSLQM